MRHIKARIRSLAIWNGNPPWTSRPRLRYWKTMSVKLLVRLLAIMAILAFPFAATAAPSSGAVCDPCPLDCPMMAKASNATGPTARPSAPAHDDRSGLPCKPDAACLATVSAIGLPGSAPATMPVITAEPFRFARVEQLPAASRPPDRSLRPPIQL